MNETCPICRESVIRLRTEAPMECAVCRRKEPGRAGCRNGHYVCAACREKGLDQIFAYCLASESSNPIEIVRGLMALPFCHIHGPEHHVMVGAALLTAYRNAGGQIALAPALAEMYSRAKQVPGGACGYWGACGAGVSTGMFISIITGSGPLKGKQWRLPNLMTSQALAAIGSCGGPRCCKRDSYLAILSAIDVVKEQFGIGMTKPEIACTHFPQNSQCIKAECPFFPGRE